MPAPDVVIIGGGIVGAACARALSVRDVSVHLIDSGSEPGRATPAAAGMLAPLVAAKAEDPLLGLSIRARELYHELAPALEAETGIDVGFWSDGVLQLAFTDDDVDRLKGAVAWQRQLGYHSEWLPGEDLRQLSPGSAPDAIGALLAPEDGALTPEALLEALLASAMSRGTRVSRGDGVDRVLTDHRRVTGVRSAGESVPAETIIVAAGCWSGRLSGLPRPLSVEPLRGQMAAFDWPADEPRAIIYAGSQYVLRRGGEALAGSTVEHAGYDSSVTEEGVGAIVEAARRIYPALRDAAVNRTWAGLRPGTPDGHPIVGPDPDTSGLWYATGHGRTGILLAGVTGEIIARWLTDEPVEHDLSVMDPGRFWRY